MTKKKRRTYRREARYPNRVMVYLSDRQLMAVEAEADATELSVSEVVRRCLDENLGAADPGPGVADHLE